MPDFKTTEGGWTIPGTIDDSYVPSEGNPNNLPLSKWIRLIQCSPVIYMTLDEGQYFAEEARTGICVLPSRFRELCDQKPKADAELKTILSDIQKEGKNINLKDGKKLYPCTYFLLEEDVPEVRGGQPLHKFSFGEIEKVIKYYSLRPLDRLKCKTTTAPRKSVVPVSRPILELNTESEEISLLSQKVPKDVREAIRAEQGKGNFQDTVTSNLTGGDARFKKFILALALILAEQSRACGTEERMLGISDRDLSSCQLTRPSIPDALKGYHTSPVVLIHYPSLIRLMGGMRPNEKLGGTEIREMKEYVKNVCRKTLITTMSNGSIVGLPVMSLVIDHYPDVMAKNPENFTEENTEKKRDFTDWGVFAILPQFSQDIKSFSKVPYDINERLRGRQDNITMTLLFILLKSQGAKEFSKRKEDLLIKCAGKKTYKKNKGEVTESFTKAVEKLKEIRLVKSYRETKSAGSETCYFTYDERFTEPLQ